MNSGTTAIIFTIILIPMSFGFLLCIIRQLSNLSNRLGVYHRNETNTVRYKNLMGVYTGLSIPLFFIFYIILEKSQPVKSGNDPFMLLVITIITTLMILLLCRVLSLIDPEKIFLPLTIWSSKNTVAENKKSVIKENKRVTNFVYALSSVSTISILLMTVITHCIAGTIKPFELGVDKVLTILLIYFSLLFLTMVIGEYILKGRVIDNLIV